MLVILLLVVNQFMSDEKRKVCQRSITYIQRLLADYYTYHGADHKTVFFVAA